MVARRVSMHERAFKSFQPDGPPRRHVLVAHIVESFLVEPGASLPTSHNHFREAIAIVDSLLELGCAVDVISYRNTTFVPKKQYDLFISARENFDIISQRLGPSCVKVVHLDVSHWLSNNSAAFARSLDLQTRRGLTLDSHIVLESTWAIENADFATMMGNDATYATYAYSGKTVFQVPNPGTALHPWPVAKDFDSCRTRFLWMGSTGLVHKGLDLVLQAFAEMPEYHLTVCGPIAFDRRFEEAFKQELFETENIELHGWIDVASDEFRELACRTLGLVYPSVAEGCAGAVVNGMHAGLIPILTPQAGVELSRAFGIELERPTVVEVQRAVRELSARPTDELRMTARSSWTEAREIYTEAHFKEVFRSVMERTIRGEPGLPGGGLVRMPRGSAVGPSDGLNGS
jgi:glycosyltransferase involved in cell wall biosynthesis